MLYSSFFRVCITVLTIFYWISYSFAEVDVSLILKLITSSAGIALIGAVTIVLFTINIAFITRVTKNIITRFAIKIFSLGYAIPGVVLSVGVITPISSMEKSLAILFDYPPESILSGTFILLLIAYLVRFSTISIKTLDSGFNKISNSYDLAASSFGYSKIQTLLKIHLPILIPTISSALILLFVDIVKELPMTLILRPFNFNTLPIHLYELAEAENLASIGVPGLILIIICLIPVIILSKGIIKNVRH